MKKVTEETVKQFVENYKKGFGTDTIAKKFNLDKTTVRKYLIKSGIRFRPAPKDIISSETHKKFIEMYKQGFSIKQIAIRCNTSFATVQRHLYKANIKLKLRGKPKEISNVAFKLTIEKAYVLGVVGPGDGFIEIKAKYLQAFADSQGCVSLEKEIYLASKNIKGLEEIKNLFDALEIKTWFCKIGLGITNKVFLENYNYKIGFTVQRKQDKLNNVLNCYTRK